MNRITEEEINKILLSSPRALPISPSASGLTGEQIKEFFYKFIRVMAEIISEHFDASDARLVSELDAHNGNGGAHPYIINRLFDLDNRDKELGNELMAQLELHNHNNSAHPEIDESVGLKISSHNVEREAHPRLVAWLTMLDEIANEALNLATGKAKIIPVEDELDMYNHLNDSLNVGDRLILAKENVPDFTLFEKNSNTEDAIPFTQLSLLAGSVEFKPGKKYICNGYLLVASESGIDTGLFAREENLTRLEDIVKEKASNADLQAVQMALYDKAEKIKGVISSHENVTLENGFSYTLGERTSLNISVNSNEQESFEAALTFKSGTEPTVISAPQDLIFVKDDCYNGELIPVANRLYEISVKRIEGALVARVSSLDYEVLR